MRDLLIVCDFATLHLRLCDFVTHQYALTMRRYAPNHHTICPIIKRRETWKTMTHRAYGRFIIVSTILSQRHLSETNLSQRHLSETIGL